MIQKLGLKFLLIFTNIIVNWLVMLWIVMKYAGRVPWVKLCARSTLDLGVGYVNNLITRCWTIDDGCLWDCIYYKHHIRYFKAMDIMANAMETAARVTNSILNI